MRKQKVTRRYADELHRNIRRRDEQIEQLQRERHTANDALHAQTLATATMEGEVDAMAAKLNKMGTDLGVANMRALLVHEVANTALNGMGALASAVGNGSQIASTLRALERDGRAQLKLAANGTHA